MDGETVLYERRGHVALITLNRPERLNALNRVMLRELQAACDAAEADDAVHAVVLTGAGRAFCSGFDLTEQADKPPRGVEEWGPVLQEDFDAVMRFWHLPKPTVSAVRGHALAGGCELALACDLTIAGEDAAFGEPELTFGAGIVVMLLPWLTGPKQAKSLLLTGEAIDAHHALAIGLINQVVPAGEEIATALALAQRIAAIEPGLAQRTKAAINESYDIVGMHQALDAALEADLEIEGAGTDVKRRFLEIVRDDGLRAALAWRDARLESDGG